MFALPVLLSLVGSAAAVIDEPRATGGNPRPDLPVTAATTRAKSIVARMTNAEKAAILNGIQGLETPITDTTSETPRQSTGSASRR